MNLTAIAIVAIVAASIVEIIKAIGRISQKKAASNNNLDEHRQQIEQLKERVEVLEKIVTDQNYDLKKQFRDLENDKVA
ncbi:hypothetical protein [Salinimonas sediminis]|uniref:Phage shock protein B n=1 Tax=Salinimonas sediminis TaxID=2303538 RepID=A0A346NJI2_9ALTE|nr:hypothetical protein [Salinimonas sediminis]AXR05689.1 hypothetical protein D0Y50_04450 [Salinimonas sediminis]